MPAIHYNRITNVALREAVRALDPNHKAPLTDLERASLSPIDRAKMHRLLGRAKVPLTLQTQKVDRAGRSVVNTYLYNLGAGDKRSHTNISTTVSKENIVEPLFPRSMSPDAAHSFDDRFFALIREAQKFIFVEGFELDRQDLVDALLAKAREGVQVVVVFDPANESSERTKGELLAKLRSAAKGDPEIAAKKSLYVGEYDVVARGGFGFDQILHVKKIIADRPDGSMAEVSGGINFGRSSNFNYDTAWYVEGVAALDSLNRLVSHFPTKDDGYPPFKLDAVPTAQELAQLTTAKVGTNTVTIELAGAGQHRVEKPRRYTVEQLQERARLGKRIVISSRDVIKPGVADMLKVALTNRSWVKVIQAEMSAKQAAQFKVIADDLRLAGAGIYREAAVLHEESYARLVYREIEAATQARESIDVAAFCLSDDGLIDRLVAAKTAGCAVRVILDDLTLDGLLINRKAMARLTAAGVEVKVFDRDTALALASPDAANPHNVKLHSKIIILGNNRVLGGSANFTNQGFRVNVEDGRLVRSAALAEAFSTRLFAPLWQRCPAAVPLQTIPQSDRVPLLPQVPMATPLSEIVFVSVDLDTTGYSPAHDDRVVSMAGQAFKLGPRGKVETLEEYNAYITPGTDPMGAPFRVPGSAVRVHGLDQDKLDTLGARRMRQVMPEFIAFLRRQMERGKVVLLGHNAAFDMRFLDHTLSRSVLAAIPGVDRASIDSPYVDLMHVSAKLFPRAAGHDLDSIIRRLEVQRTRRGQHEAIDDVRLAAAALGRMLNRASSQLLTLGDLMGPDLLALQEPLELAEAPSGALAWVVEDVPGAGIYLRRKLGDGQLSPPQRVTELEVLDVDLDTNQLSVRVDAGYGSKAQKIFAFVAVDKLSFRAPGRVYNRLREAGRAVKKADILQPT
jgi:phosphatidylserine/phosphatidylglycerophosphate/cardiolipin synthase-like enzyme/DNA polymerase III epsilon subunit-like protein